MRLQITGSREWTDAIKISEVLTAVPIPANQITLVHGGARGADSIAGAIGRGLGFQVEVHYAEWDRYGKRAGYIRNAAMADLLDPDEDWALAFLQRGDANTGTRMMIDLCKQRGVEVMEVWSDENSR